jgi:hypothetical protein
MSIPLDRLYHYIESIAEQIHGDNVLIYRFYPHGSKKLEDLSLASPMTWVESILSPQIFCNDQEPLHWELYNNADRMFNSNWNKILLNNSFSPRVNNLCSSFGVYDKNIILHSEQRSSQCEIYEKNNFVLAYYWSHAFMAQDWFRFAKHVDQKKHVKKMFLIYNRAWSGTREYRLKFLELLINAQLENHCQTNIIPIEPELGVHYNSHVFQTPQWRPNLPLENYFPTVLVPSHYSADFDLADYENTNIEIVLETLFDDERLHLTEKSLRPIACAQPFILSATVGSLEYLRKYGFKTYSSVWNEDYDLISDPKKRLQAIIKLMNDIANWDCKTSTIKLKQAQEIADFNKTYFFSQEFFTLINNELEKNLSDALCEIKNTNTAQSWLAWRRKIATSDKVRDIITGRCAHPDSDKTPEFFSSHTRKNIAKVMTVAMRIANKSIADKN